MRNASPIAAKLFVLAGLLACSLPGAAQPAYPSKPMRFIVPYAGGSTLDIMGRMIGQKLSESWGQPIILDNRPGGNAIIGDR